MHTETLAPNTQKVFQKLGTLDVIKPFYLSGGTALALYLGHRESEDLDFFSKEDFNPQKLQQDLENSIKLSGVSQDKGTFDCYAENVKLQFLHYPYKLISKPTLWNGVTISAVADIACTKLITISSRGSKKDFIDLYFILQTFSLDELFSLISKKYHQVDYNLLHILKSLVFFETAEEQPVPKMHKNVSWAEVKKFLTETTKSFSI
jgi:predicted nucleotidyltransferase component of viral defense system